MKTDKELFAILDEDPPQFSVDEEVWRETLRMAHRCNGSIRIATGKYFTDAEFEEKRRRVYGTALP